MTRDPWPFALALTAVVFGAQGSLALDARLSSGEARWREGAAAFTRRIAHKEGALQRINAAMAHLVAEAKPAVVMIHYNLGEGKGGSGTGFLVHRSGLVLTNAHVAAPVGLGGKATARFADGTELPAVVAALGKEEGVDLALLRLDSPRRDWPVLKLGSAKSAREGHMALTLGYPRGLPFSVAQGVVSGNEHRGLRVRYLQTDAALNPGNSGGPLVAMDGTVLGVNTSIASASGGSEGIGFAISADAAKEFISRRRAGNPAQPACPDPGRISKDWDALRTSDPPPGMVAAHHAAARAAAAPLLIEIAGRGYWLGMSHRSDRMAEAEREPGCFASGSAAFYYVGPEEEPELDFTAAAAADERALLPRLLELRWLDPKTGRRVRWVDTSLGARIGWATDGRDQPADWPIPLPAGLNTLY